MAGGSEETCPEFTALRKCYSSLTVALPLDDMMPQLITQRVVDMTDKERIMSRPSDSDKVGYFLDKVLMKPLNVGDTKMFKIFLSILRQCRKGTSLAAELEKQLDMIYHGQTALPTGEYCACA